MNCGIRYPSHLNAKQMYHILHAVDMATMPQKASYTRQGLGQRFKKHRQNWFGVWVVQTEVFFEWMDKRFVETDWRKILSEASDVKTMP